MTSWINPLSKKSSLTPSGKPMLGHGFLDHQDERRLEMTYVALMELEETSTKLYKEVKRYEEAIVVLQRLEQKITSDLANSPLLPYDPDLKQISEEYQSVTYQLGHHTDDLVQLSEKTVVEPMKKWTAEFSSIAAAIRRRDLALQKAINCKEKHEKLAKLERTGSNIVKIEKSRKDFETAREDFNAQNRLLLLELPQFYEKRIDYFQPSLQAFIRSQVDFYGESTKLFTHLAAVSKPAQTYSSQNVSNLESQSSPSRSKGPVPSIGGLLATDETYKEEVNEMLNNIKGLSIVAES